MGGTRMTILKLNDLKSHPPPLSFILAWSGFTVKTQVTWPINGTQTSTSVSLLSVWNQPWQSLSILGFSPTLSFFLSLSLSVSLFLSFSSDFSASSLCLYPSLSLPVFPPSLFFPPFVKSLLHSSLLLWLSSSLPMKAFLLGWDWVQPSGARPGRAKATATQAHYHHRCCAAPGLRERERRLLVSASPNCRQQLKRTRESERGEAEQTVLACSPVIDQQHGPIQLIGLLLFCWKPRAVFFL